MSCDTRQVKANFCSECTIWYSADRDNEEPGNYLTYVRKVDFCKEHGHCYLKWQIQRLQKLQDIVSDQEHFMVTNDIEKSMIKSLCFLSLPNFNNFFTNVIMQ